jgi:hypothetical protein
MTNAEFCETMWHNAQDIVAEMETQLANENARAKLLKPSRDPHGLLREKTSAHVAYSTALLRVNLTEAALAQAEARRDDYHLQMENALRRAAKDEDSDGTSEPD